MKRPIHPSTAGTGPVPALLVTALVLAIAAVGCGGGGGGDNALRTEGSVATGDEPGGAGNGSAGSRAGRTAPRPTTRSGSSAAPDAQAPPASSGGDASGTAHAGTAGAGAASGQQGSGSTGIGVGGGGTNGATPSTGGGGSAAGGQGGASTGGTTAGTSGGGSRSSGGRIPGPAEVDRSGAVVSSRGPGGPVIHEQIADLFARIYADLPNGREAVMDETAAVVSRKDNAQTATPSAIAGDVAILVSAAEEVARTGNLEVYRRPTVRNSFERVQAYEG